MLKIFNETHRFFNAIKKYKIYQVEKMLNSNPKLIDAKITLKIYSHKFKDLNPIEYKNKVAFSNTMDSMEKLLIAYGCNTDYYILNFIEQFKPYVYEDSLAPRSSIGFNTERDKESWERRRKLQIDWIKWVLSKRRKETKTKELASLADRFREEQQHDIEYVIQEYLGISTEAITEDFHEIDEVERTLMEYWQNLAKGWWQGRVQETVICDYRNCEIEPDKGYLIGNKLACEECCKRLVSGAKNNLKHNPDYFGVGMLERAKKFYESKNQT
jgi:hypothetical protein